MSEITELRRSLAGAGTKFQVIKNTLMRRAVNDTGVAELEALLDGPSAVAFVEGDPVAAAKSVVDAAKKYPTLVLKGGFMDGKMLSADDAKALASLESREVMLSKIAGLVKAEMSKAAALFVGAQSKFLSVLEAFKEKLPGDEAAPGGDAAPSSAADAASDSSSGVTDLGDAESASADGTAPSAEETGTDETTEAEASSENESEEG